MGQNVTAGPYQVLLTFSINYNGVRRWRGRSVPDPANHGNHLDPPST